MRGCWEACLYRFEPSFVTDQWPYICCLISIFHEKELTSLNLLVSWLSVTGTRADEEVTFVPFLKIPSKPVTFLGLFLITWTMIRQLRDWLRLETVNKFSRRQFRNKGEARLVTPFTSNLTVSFYVKINSFKLATPCFVFFGCVCR